MQHYIAPNGEIIAPVTYGVDVFDPQDLPRDEVRSEAGEVLEPAHAGTLLHAADDEVPIGQRFHADFVATLEPYDPDNPPPTPEVPEPEPSVPSSVTMRQARLALLAAGKLQAVADAIAGLPSPQREAAQIEWEFASTVERGSAFLESLATLLELSSDDLDELFTAAVQL